MLRLPTVSRVHAFAFAGFAVVPAALTGLLALGGASGPVVSQLAIATPALQEPAPPAALFPSEPGNDRLAWEADSGTLMDRAATEAATAAASSPGLDALRGPEASDFECLPEAPAASAPREAEGRLKSGQTIGDALLGHGVDASEVHELVTSMRSVYDFRRAPAGARYDLAWNEGGERLTRFCFRPDQITSYEATRQDDGRLAIRELKPELRVEEVEILARIETSLYQAIADAGESPSLASKISDVFAWDLDFSRDQHRGDTFRMIVEKRFRGETLIDYGQVLAAEYAGKRGTFRAFWYSPDGSRAAGRFYLEDGRSAEKTFLASPVEYTRVSSSFNKKRKHPILGFTKAHYGTDFAAPTGTPVRAMADGVVSFAGRKGPSGKLIVLDHANGLKTYYAHLDSFAKDMKKGRRVGQKQLIGRVGTTGRSTGPHLHLGVKSNGKWVDPQRLKITRADPVLPAQMPAFRGLAEAQQARLATLSLPGEAGTSPEESAAATPTETLAGSRSTHVEVATLSGRPGL